MAQKRFDIVADTHGYLSPALLKELEGADAIVHAGDICSPSDFRTLCDIAPLHLCLGNNDWAYDYGPDVKRAVTFYGSGLLWEINHYREKLRLADGVAVGVCGHTHKPFIDNVGSTIVMNPGSPTFPRSHLGPTMGRIICDEGTILAAEIIQLDT